MAPLKAQINLINRVKAFSVNLSTVVKGCPQETRIVGEEQFFDFNKLMYNLTIVLHEWYVVFPTSRACHDMKRGGILSPCFSQFTLENCFHNISSCTNSSRSWILAKPLLFFSWHPMVQSPPIDPTAGFSLFFLMKRRWNLHYLLELKLNSFKKVTWL